MGISGYNCAFLALSVALKIEHYDLCLAAKIAQLTGEFQAKLGWLVGNLYSRVGTKEWGSVYPESVSELRKKIVKPMFACLPAKQINACLKKLSTDRTIAEYSPEEIVDFIKKNKPVKKSKDFSDNLKMVLEKTIKDEIPNREELIDQLHSSIISDAAIKSLIQHLD